MASPVADLLAGSHDVLRSRQVEREKAQREAATGVRARAVLRGDLGPVLRRWVTVSILPVSRRMRSLCDAILAGAYPEAANLAASPVFGLPDLTTSVDLHTVLRWALAKDRLDDLVLTVMGEVISATATEGKPIPLTRALTGAANKARETGIGQFITQVQGAKAMLKVRRGAGWAQKKSMDAVAALMSGQVRDGIAQKEELGELPIRGKVVLTVLTPEGKERRVDLRPPSKEDWEFLSVARTTRGEKDAHLGTWSAFAMLVLCCAQAEAGWFDLVRISKKASRGNGGRRHTGSHGLVLSESAHGAIKKDIDKWLRLGFIREPMLVQPENGDYLTVKHRPVAGGQGPMGLKTDPKGTRAWRVAAEVMANTWWTVPEGTLKALHESEFIQGLAAKAEPDEARRVSILAAYKRLAKDAFTIPIYMDFRGRVYTRSNLVTYQGRDLQKALLCFPPTRDGASPSSSKIRAEVLHASGLYGLDKATWKERYAWWGTERVQAARLFATGGQWEAPSLVEVLSEAAEPLQLLTAFILSGTDRMACQIDGTCNGLQHLTALFRDETAAPYVNLVPSTFNDGPADIYAEVGRRVAARLGDVGEPWARRLSASIHVDRALCKKPVMVLPYGGTRVTIEDAVLEAILDQAPGGRAWTHGLTDISGEFSDGFSTEVAWPDWEAGKYEAFQDRDLADHPLLHLDARRLGGLVWDAIVEILPRPMAAMQAFRDIAKQVGERTLEWRTGPSEDDLWVVQAKPKSAASPLHLKGLHLPGSVRGLAIRPGKDAIDPHAHVTGIVANFIHSMDAAHQTGTMEWFYREGCRSFGGIFDCYITRPSEMAKLKVATRETFAFQYALDPLSWPVRVRHPSGSLEEFPSWYVLAAACGVTFPAPGTWSPMEALESFWMFS